MPIILKLNLISRPASLEVITISYEPKVFFKNPNPLSLQILTFFFRERSGLISISFNLQDHHMIPQITDVQKRLKLQFVGYVQGEGKQSSMSYFIARLTNKRDLA